MLEVLMGNMFSSKTSTLIGKLTTYHNLGKKVLYVNHQKDIRGTDFSTHGNVQLPEDLHRVKTERLTDVKSEGYFAIGVDEAQWFPDLRETVKQWLSKDILVICAGLNGDFKQEPFGTLPQIIPLADRVIHLTAKCMIHLELTGEIVDAPFTKKLTSDPTVDQPGGADLYIAVCRKHL